MNTFNSNLNSSRAASKIAILGTFPPTQCGIATFTADLSRSIRTAWKGAEVDIFVIREDPDMHYGDEVYFEIAEQSQASYVEAAQLINNLDYDAVSIQHEYGIFGGIAGSFLLDFVWEVKVPIITTLHTVLDNPSMTQKLVLEALLNRSERIIVMSKKAVELLVSVHGIDSEKIEVIPHGVPLVPKEYCEEYRLEVPLESPLILTFGLLSPDKGIEYVIEALPEIIKTYPNATYAVIGATHPHILASQGEAYRESLVDLAEDLGVTSHVRFINEFVPVDDLIGYLSAMDIYVTPYLKPHQITSGTLAYAIGAGKAVISTPYWYAQELLDEGRGLLVPFRDSQKLAEAVVSLESDLVKRHEMGLAAEEYGRSMQWPEVGQQYCESIQIALEEMSIRARKADKPYHTQPKNVTRLPALNTFHLREMTDDVGLLQHATHSVPLRSEGYCIDDNARALLLTALIEQQEKLPESLNLAQSRYLGFVLDAFNSEGGRFRNFMGYQRNWLEQMGSEDSHGRTIWALGTMIHKSENLGRRSLSVQLFKDALPALEEFSSPRAWAYGIMGAAEYLSVFPHDLQARAVMEKLAERMLLRHDSSCSGDWHWFEDSLTYANARLPQSLILAGQVLIDETMLNAGLHSLEWLRLMQIDKEGNFSPVGSSRPYEREGDKDYFDQQPVEAAASVSAYLAAWRATGYSTWLAEAHRAFRWFLGGNINQAVLYDETNGGCYDGLHPDRINQNQGAESTLSFLSALTELRAAVSPPPIREVSTVRGVR